jgi:hypothetical protein
LFVEYNYPTPLLFAGLDRLRGGWTAQPTGLQLTKHSALPLEWFYCRHFAIVLVVALAGPHLSLRGRDEQAQG